MKSQVRPLCVTVTWDLLQLKPPPVFFSTFEMTSDGRVPADCPTVPSCRHRADTARPPARKGTAPRTRVHAGPHAVTHCPSLLQSLTQDSAASVGSPSSLFLLGCHDCEALKSVGHVSRQLSLSSLFNVPSCLDRGYGWGCHWNDVPLSLHHVRACWSTLPHWRGG